MEQLAQLREHIDSLVELRELVHAMRAVAGSRVQEAQTALAGIRRYTDVVTDAIGEALTLLDDPLESGLESNVGYATLIVVASEHGFAGGFNERLLAQADRELRQDQRLGVVGQRGEALARERGSNPAWTLPMATHTGGVLATARQVSNRLRDCTDAVIVYVPYTSASLIPVGQRLLPLDLASFVRRNSLVAPAHYLSAALLLAELGREYLFAGVAHALMESLASENAARLRAMQAADQNIGERLDGLRQTERVRRQDEITTELLDVVTGAEAILQQR